MLGTGTQTKVLVVEDEPLLRMNAVDILEDAGFYVEQAADGDAALDILRSVSGLHVLFTDVQMPGSIDGLALAHLTSRDFPDVGVIVVSGRAAIGENRLPPRAVFMAKPYEAKKVVMHVHRARRAT